MNVSVSQARPNNATAETMPALKTDDSGISFADGLQMRMISAATVSITIWMIGVTPIGSVVPSAAAMCGRRSGNKPNTTIVRTPTRKMYAALRPGLVNVSASAADPDATAASLPSASRAWYSGSSSRSLPLRIMMIPETMIPTIAAGMVTDSTLTMSKLYGATSVSVIMAAIAAETGLQARAMPETTTVIDSGRSGRIFAWYETS
jgi:hypothetical protein